MEYDNNATHSEKKNIEEEMHDLFVYMKDALRNKDWESVMGLYEEALKTQHPKGLPQYCLGYYIIALYNTDRTERATEMEKYRMEYDKYTQDDLDAYIAGAKSNIAEKKFQNALLDLEKAYEHCYFLFGKDAPETVRVMKMQVFASLALFQTKKTLILASTLDADAIPEINFAYMKAYSRWGEKERSAEYKEKLEASGLDIESVLTELFDDGKVAKKILESIKG